MQNNSVCVVANSRSYCDATRSGTKKGIKQSVLRLRDRDGQATHGRGSLDLAREPAVWPWFAGELQHAALEFVHRREQIEPFRVDIDVTRGTGTRTAAIAVDPDDVVL